VCRGLHDRNGELHGLHLHAFGRIRLGGSGLPRRRAEPELVGEDYPGEIRGIRRLGERWVAIALDASGAWWQAVERGAAAAGNVEGRGALAVRELLFDHHHLDFGLRYLRYLRSALVDGNRFALRAVLVVIHIRSAMMEGAPGDLARGFRWRLASPPELGARSLPTAIASGSGPRTDRGCSVASWDPAGPRRSQTKGSNSSATVPTRKVATAVQRAAAETGREVSVVLEVGDGAVPVPIPSADGAVAVGDAGLKRRTGR